MKKSIFFTALLIMMTSNLFAQEHRYDPPWNPADSSSLQFTVPGVDNAPDIFGDINNPQLVIFMGGNQFMVLDELIAAFKKNYPQYQRILVETLPPGLLMKQIKTGSLQMGNMRITLKPDIYSTGKNTMEENKELFSRTEVYTATKLALMVQKGNPKKITSLLDLSGKSIRISMPDKAIEGIGKNVEEAYLKTGGQALYDAIMKQKVKDSTTFITQIHHRQSPMRILYNQSDVAPVWETEIIYQQQLGHPVDKIDIPATVNKVSVSAAGILKNAPNKEAATAFINFLTGDEAKAIFKKFGFMDVPAN